MATPGNATPCKAFPGKATPGKASPSMAGLGMTALTNAKIPPTPSCNLCNKRKIKCHVVEGSSLKVCGLCKKKGVDCVFEQPKEYPAMVTSRL